MYLDSKVFGPDVLSQIAHSFIARKKTKVNVFALRKQNYETLFNMFGSANRMTLSSLDVFKKLDGPSSLNPNFRRLVSPINLKEQESL